MLTDIEKKEKHRQASKRYYDKNKENHNTEEYRRKNVIKAIKWQKANPEKVKVYQARLRQRNKDYISQYLSNHPCIECKESDIYCLTFHHIDRKNKSKAVSALAKRSSIKRISEEIKKCIVLCHNCHNKRHAIEIGIDNLIIDEESMQHLSSIKKTRTRDRTRKRLFILEHKKNSKCTCGEGNYLCLVFHHRDPATKKFALSEATRKSLSSIKEEISKCDIMCANCHIKLHYY